MVDGLELVLEAWRDEPLAGNEVNSASPPLAICSS